MWLSMCRHDYEIKCVACSDTVLYQRSECDSENGEEVNHQIRQA